MIGVSRENESYSFYCLKVFDVNGREVAALLNERVAAGVHRVDFDGNALSSGVYFARLRSAAHAKMTRLVLIK
ncbi:T9SS type A sorting domain-containing protein [bacterium]|nr:T9SS type A sorting domain-containing protein [bacterium]